jgi:uncharacterized delta-60 repeat protein
MRWRERSVIWFVVLGLLSAIALPSIAQAVGPGVRLDSAFGTDGLVTTSIGPASAAANAVAIQPDGRIIAVGRAAGAGGSDFAVARYNPDGSPDPTFDTDGITTTSIGAEDEAWALAVQADGKIIAAGYSFNATALVRYNVDGSLDPSFDTDGVVTTPCSAGGPCQALSVAVQTDGEIVVAGYSAGAGGNTFALARYDASGSLDSSFDGDGLVSGLGPSSPAYAYAIAIQSDNKIVVGGTASGNGFALVRYNADGSLDATVTTPINPGAGVYEKINAIAIQPDNKIVVAGQTSGGTNADFTLARYNSNLSLDSTFDTDGVVRTPIGWDDYARAVAIQAGGRIVAAGDTSNGGSPSFALVLYNSNGSIDTTFDADGIVTTPIDTQASANAVSIQPNGRIVAAGWTSDGANQQFALARYVSVALPVCTITGTSGADTLTGTSGDDVICGLAGDDTIKTSAGNDVLWGGEGRDTVDFSAAGGPISADLEAGTAIGDGSDLLYDDERLVGSAYSDTLVGSSGSDDLWGGGGNDTLTGGSGEDVLFGNDGDDTLVPQGGNDTVDGGLGIDAVSYADLGESITVDLASGNATSATMAGSDTLGAVENVIGTAYGDAIAGSNGANVITSGGGNDFIDGGGGSDSLIAGDGDDSIDGKDGNDRIDGAGGMDTLAGGLGDDKMATTSCSGAPARTPSTAARAWTSATTPPQRLPPTKCGPAKRRATRAMVALLSPSRTWSVARYCGGRTGSPIPRHTPRRTVTIRIAAVAQAAGPTLRTIGRPHPFGASNVALLQIGPSGLLARCCRGLRLTTCFAYQREVR